MCELLAAGRAAGRRDSVVVVAEGHVIATAIRSAVSMCAKVLADRLGEDVRREHPGAHPAVVEHRAPSTAGWGTLVGHAAVEALQAATPDSEPQLIGMPCITA